LDVCQIFNCTFFWLGHFGRHCQCP
jgi:hypothetical protein